MYELAYTLASRAMPLSCRVSDCYFMKRMFPTHGSYGADVHKLQLTQDAEYSLT